MGGEEGGGGGGGGVARRCRAAPGARAWVWRGGRGSRVALRRARLPASTAGARGHEHCGKIRGDTGRYGEIWPRSRALWRAASARVRCRRAKREVGGCVGGGPDWLSAISAGPRRLGSIWTRSRLDLGYLSARISPSSRRACEAPAGDRGTSPAPEVARGEPRRGRGEPTAPDLGQSQRSRPISRLHPLVMHLDVHLPRLRKMSHAPVATHEPTPLPPLPLPRRLSPPRAPRPLHLASCRPRRAAATASQPASSATATAAAAAAAAAATATDTASATSAAPPLPASASASLLSPRHKRSAQLLAELLRLRTPP